MSKLRTQSWKIHIATTLVGWFIAFVIVYGLLTVFGEQLESLPHVLNALIFTGIMVAIMGNVVMPPVDAAVTRYFDNNKRKGR